MNAKNLIGGGVMVILMVIIVIQFFPSLLGTLDDIQKDDATAIKNSTTGGGITTDTVLLAEPLYDDNIAYVTALTSDNGSDTPVAASYASATDTLTVSGLAAAGTRVMTVYYTSEALDGNTGLKDAVRMAGFILFIGLILAAFSAIYNSSKGSG